MSGPVQWSRWTVILLKPDCLTRGLLHPVLAMVACRLTLVDQRTVVATEQQVAAHYQDLLTDRRAQFTWIPDMAAELRRIYAGHRVGIALGHSPHPDTAARVRDLLGHYDPARAAPDTIRGRFGDDSQARACTEERLIANLIHSSDDPAGAEREFGIWYGHAATRLLHPAHQPCSKGATHP